MCPSVRRRGESEEKGKILSALMSSFLENQKKKKLKTKRVPAGFKNSTAISESQHNKIPSYIQIVDSSCSQLVHNRNNRGSISNACSKSKNGTSEPVVTI